MLTFVSIGNHQGEYVDILRNTKGILFNLSKIEEAFQKLEQAKEKLGKEKEAS